MIRIFSAYLILAAAGSGVHAQDLPRAAQDAWFQVQTPHFTVFTSGSLDQSRRLAASLEQFRKVYSTLAGPKVVLSVPVVVVAFTNEQAFAPFRPSAPNSSSRVRGFFQRDYDANMIALDLESMPTGSMEVIFHEYAHFLMRENNHHWPLWLAEGMAEVYSTFRMEKGQVCFGGPKAGHLDFLQNATVSVADLFAVSQRALSSNEASHHGDFYARSWALTHYLVLGNPVRKNQYPVFAKRLRDGTPAETAFTEAFQTNFAGIEAELRQYIARGVFDPVCFNLDPVSSGAQPAAVRALPKVEVLYQLGNLLLHCRRLDEAQDYFEQALAIAPGSARPYEGLGLLAARRKDRAQTIHWIDQALARNSANPRAQFEYARALILADDGRFTIGGAPTATSARARDFLQRTIRAMPAFAPAHYLLGLMEMEQGRNLAQAAAHLQSALRLEPENRGYVLALGHLQVRRGDLGGARRTLLPLLASGTDPKIREAAEKLLNKAK